MKKQHWVNTAQGDAVRIKSAGLAMLALQSEGTDISPDVWEMIGGEMDVPADTAKLILRDQITEAIKTWPVSLSAKIENPPPRKPDKFRGSPVAVYEFKMGISRAPENDFWRQLMDSLGQPPRYLRKCHQCGNVFEPKRPEAKYCSAYCRNLANS